jgi:uncharacterized membrane protein YbhN (UPF0104 family)
MSTEHIARRTVAFFFLTSLANVAGVILFAALYAVGVLHDNPNPALTYGFGAAALAATVVVLALPAVLARKAPGARAARRSSKLGGVIRFVRNALGQGIREGVDLLRSGSIGVLAGSIGTMAFDLAVLGACFAAFGYSPPLGVLALGYLIGQLGGNVPLPFGIGGVDGGLIGTFALFHQPLAVTGAAVLVYHAIALWVPALPGSVAFIQLRRTLQRAVRPAVVCMPLAEPLQTARQTAAVG